MARPIALELPPRDPREELRDRLQQAPVAHAEALLDACELLRGGFSASDKLIEITVDAAKSDESVRAMRNAILLGKMLGSINPEALQRVVTALGETLGGLRKPAVEPPGVFALLNRFRTKEARRSIALMGLFLEKLGAEFK